MALRGQSVEMVEKPYHNLGTLFHLRQANGRESRSNAKGPVRTASVANDKESGIGRGLVHDGTETRDQLGSVERPGL